MRLSILMIVALALPALAQAQDATQPATGMSENGSAETAPGSGAQTRAWLDLQQSGRESDKVTRPLPGDVATHIYDRYVKSFDHAIPDQYSREKFVSGGGSGGGQ